MASFPGAKVHRVSRRRLGRGQSVQRPGATVTAAATTVTVTLTFDVPVIVSARIPLVIATNPAFVSQTVVSPTVVHQVYGSSCAGLAWSLAGNAAGIATFQGGGVAAAAGTF